MMWKRLGTLVLALPLFVDAGCSSRGAAPVTSRSVSPAPAGVQRPPVLPSGEYRVQRGDTLYSIAWRQNLEYKQLAAWNGIRGPAYSIYPGQRLRLRPPMVRHPLPRPLPRSSPGVHRPGASPSRTRPPPAGPASVSRQAPKPSPARSMTASQKSFKLNWTWPTNGKVVRTFSAADDQGKGIWIHGSMGQPVLAAEAGKVVYAGSGLVGYGNLIIIKHDRAFLSAYGYNSRLLVKEGDVVKKGDPVARMGSPNSGGQPLLHFEIRKQGTPINPLPMLPQR